MCAEVSSSVPHFLQVGLLLNPITCRCLLMMCSVSRPITALVCVLLKDSNWAPVARSGSEINSRACLCVLHEPQPQCQTLVLHPAFHFPPYILPRDPQKGLKPNKLLTRTAPCEPVSDLIPSHSGMTRDPI